MEKAREGRAGHGRVLLCSFCSWHSPHGHERYPPKHIATPILGDGLFRRALRIPQKPRRRSKVSSQVSSQRDTKMGGMAVRIVDNQKIQQKQGAPKGFPGASEQDTDGSFCRKLPQDQSALRRDQGLPTLHAIGLGRSMIQQASLRVT